MREDYKIRRQHRLEALLKQELSMILFREAHDPRLQFITVTEVQLRKDLKTARVYVSRLLQDGAKEPSTEDCDQLLHGLTSAAGFIHAKLKKRLSIKIVPNLHFEYDWRISKISQVWKLTNPLIERRASYE